MGALAPRSNAIGEVNTRGCVVQLLQEAEDVLLW